MGSAVERLEYRAILQLKNPMGELNQKATGYERSRGQYVKAG
jgi:hypothetical protein